jgi:hypothetical protein
MEGYGGPALSVGKVGRSGLLKIIEPARPVLGNHDTIQMVPTMEAMGIRILLNEFETIVRGDQRIYLAGIDDAHF